MAKLFKDNIIKEKLQSFEIPEFEDKLKMLENWYKLHKNSVLKAKKEEELEGPFGNDFFGSLLGYDCLTENHTYNRKFQPKVPVGGQKADIGLGFFDATQDIMKVVVELKDANTSLDKPQQRAGNLTPVQQAFKYKPYFKETDFIIVSNFYETRLYIDSYYDYEAWTLDDLVDSKDNYYNFRKFYYLLNKENLITKSGDSNTKSLLSHIRIQEKEITKEFYREYSDLRKELLKDIIKNNPGFKKSELDLVLNKSQKIIDRIIFIHFCEDLGLLPNGKLKENLLRAEEIGFTPWEMLKKFFEFVNSGSKNLGIPDGYNGGLFKTDEIIEKIKVGDDICKKFVDLGEYDFENDLSVNILGHIFEQSISDIEELKDKINKDEDINKTSKRKKDGIFYTPEYIVDYIVKNSVGKKIDEWEEELKEKHSLKEDITDKNYTKRAILVYEELQQKVHAIKVLDPACGSGAFLVKVFDFLLDKNKEIANKIIDLKGGSKQIGLEQSESHFKSILQNNIYGVDLNEESVEITKLSLWLKTAQKGKKLANLDSNIKCGNSLIDDKEIAGDKAFVWEEEFKEIFDNGGFDVVVGNPPYTYRNAISEEEKKYFSKKYNSSEGNFDLYKLFTDKLKNLVKNDGLCSFIIPNTFLSAKTYNKLRRIIIDNFSVLEIFDLGLGVFENVVVESIIFLFKKSIEKEYNTKIFVQHDRNKVFLDYEKFYNINLQSNFLNDGIFNINLTDENKKIFEQVGKKSLKLKNIGYSTVGINTGYIKNELTSDKKIDNTYHKMLNGKDISRYLVSWKGERIKYDIDFVKSFGEKGRSLPPEYIFKNDKILVQRTRRGMKRKLVCCYDSEEYYNLNRLSNIVLENKNFDLKYIFILLNSELLDYYFNNAFNEYEVKPLHLSELPIKNIPLSDQKPFIDKADFMLDKNKQLQEKLNKFLSRLKGNFRLEKFSKKLEAFYDLEFSNFIKELKKNKIELSLKDQDEWEDYFNDYKKEILELKTGIDKCDREIDDMVFDLYGLSESEREVVLGV